MKTSRSPAANSEKNSVKLIMVRESVGALILFIPILFLSLVRSDGHASHIVAKEKLEIKKFVEGR